MTYNLIQVINQSFLDLVARLWANVAASLPLQHCDRAAGILLF